MTKPLAGEDRGNARPFVPQQADDKRGRANRGQGEKNSREKLGHRNLPEVMSANRP
jgi:hypothetical protein